MSIELPRGFYFVPPNGRLPNKGQLATIREQGISLLTRLVFYGLAILLTLAVVLAIRIVQSDDDNDGYPLHVITPVRSSESNSNVLPESTANER